ncbi:transcription repressor NadR [Eubacterium xylanophilum]|uniref:transcription repressor NadR n=1 Tax=Eubacterium xylanophilum TaxID=39497 RepID=UPI00047D4086|nr:transcription repressor NadR [Eubacterium xylanophilum]MCR5798406.1 transcription repressor NadR [Eubacterium sp.]
MSKDRQNRILQILRTSSSPVSGTKLARECDVSRQVIVQDIAVLRAANVDIISTNRGYIIQHEGKAVRTFKMCNTDDQTEDALKTIVYYGGVVENDYVNHKVYGRVEVELNIRSNRDVTEFIERIKSGKSTPLKNITSDYHYHTVSAESEEILDLIEEALLKKNYLIIKK